MNTTDSQQTQIDYTLTAPSYLKTLILVPSILSFATSLILTIIIIVNRSKQTLFSKFVFWMALSDLIYTFMGIFFTFERYYQKCPVFLSSTREYTRLVSWGFAILFAYMTYIVAKTRRVQANKKFLNKCFFLIFSIPLIFILVFLVKFQHEYLDLICWYKPTVEEDINPEKAKLILTIPVIATFSAILIIYTFIIIIIKKRIAEQRGLGGTGSAYELLVYPLGILICYTWLIMEYLFPSNGTRVLDIFCQQLQGFVNFLIYGMNYQTRTQLKDYWNRISNRVYEFFHLQEKEKEVELQLLPFNGPYSYQSR